MRTVTANTTIIFANAVFARQLLFRARLEAREYILTKLAELVAEFAGKNLPQLWRRMRRAWNALIESCALRSKERRRAISFIPRLALFKHFRPARAWNKNNDVTREFAAGLKFARDREKCDRRALKVLRDLSPA